MKSIIRLFFKTVRVVLGPVVLFREHLLTRRKPDLPEQEVRRRAQLVKPLTLYEFPTCPFCSKVRIAAHGLGLTLARRDAQHDPKHRQDLIDAIGIAKVPCLRVDHADGRTEWIRESNHVITYLEQLVRLETREAA